MLLLHAINRCKQIFAISISVIDKKRRKKGVLVLAHLYFTGVHFSITQWLTNIREFSRASASLAQCVGLLVLMCLKPASQVPTISNLLQATSSLTILFYFCDRIGYTSRLEPNSFIDNNSSKNYEGEKIWVAIENRRPCRPW